MSLPLELGQVSDPYARRALEQVSVRWGQNPLRVVTALPAVGATGDMALFGGNVYVYNGTAWKQLAYV